MATFTIVADEDIVDLVEYFGDLGDIVRLPADKITTAQLKNADILLLRSITRADQALLQGTKIRFVGTASAGLDNLDTNYLDRQNIRWAYAPGCNACAVADYVLCCLASLLKQGMIIKSLSKLKAGVIGIGHVGSLVVTRLQKLGVTVIQNDPPKALKEKNFYSTPLTEFKNLDFISLHPALNKTGPTPSYHLIDKHFLQQQRHNTILINTARGGIINTTDLMKYGHHCHWVFDVWENEPEIDLDVLQKAIIATPHIAGYSRQAKARATKMLREAYSGVESKSKAAVEKPQIFNKTQLQKCLNLYDPLEETRVVKRKLLKNNINVAHTFNMLRKSHVLRHEISGF